MSTNDHSHTITASTTPPRRRRRVFMWTFLALQVIFLVWIIAGIATANNAPDHATIVAACHHHGWVALFKSQHDCMIHYASGLKQAGDAGTAIGAGLVVALWVAVDVILGIGRLVVVTSRNRSDRRRAA